MWALIGGLVAIVVGILLVSLASGWALFTQAFLAGGFVVLLFLGGLVAIASGISDIKDQVAEKKEKKQEKENKAPEVVPQNTPPAPEEKPVGPGGPEKKES